MQQNFKIFKIYVTWLQIRDRNLWFFGKRKFLCLTFFLPFTFCEHSLLQHSSYAKEFGLKAAHMKSSLQISLQDIQLQFLSFCHEFLDILGLTSILFNFAILSFCMINAISCDFVIQWMSNSQRCIFLSYSLNLGQSDKCFGKIY